MPKSTARWISRGWAILLKVCHLSYCSRNCSGHLRELLRYLNQHMVKESLHNTSFLKSNFLNISLSFANKHHDEPFSRGLCVSCQLRYTKAID
jgi:hypothetical protein